MHIEPYRIINDLEVHNLRTNKEAIIQLAAKEGNNDFFEGCRLALDPLITFGVKQIPEKKDTTGNGLSWEAFTLALTGLTTRKVTGNAARAMINSLMNAATFQEWNNWYRRILNKDLRCGVSEKTINKVVAKNWPQYKIPVFSCQLAQDSANHAAKLFGEKILQRKLDGVRILTVVYPDGRVNQFSRNGKELVNFTHIKDQIAKTVTGITEPVVFDGEIMSTSFQDLMKQVHRKSDVDVKDAILYLFDLIPLAAFEKGIWTTDQLTRCKKVTAWKDLWNQETPNVQVLDYEIVDLNTNEGQIEFERIREQAINDGFEGLVIKDPTAPYECKRTTSWLKYKPNTEVSLTVVAVDEGTGRNKNRLGALVCEGVDDEKFIQVNVGSGFSDDDRINYWRWRDELIGQIVEVRADVITQNQDGTYSLRFPRFVCFRGFEPGEKL